MNKHYKSSTVRRVTITGDASERKEAFAWLTANEYAIIYNRPRVLKTLYRVDAEHFRMVGQKEVEQC